MHEDLVDSQAQRSEQRVKRGRGSVRGQWLRQRRSKKQTPCQI